MNLETFSTKVQEEVKSNHGIDIPWDDILDIVLQLVDGCFESEGEFTQSARNPTRLQKAGMRIHARRAGLNRKQAKAFQCCCCDICEDCSDEDLAGCYSEAKTLMSGGFTGGVIEDEVQEGGE